MTVKEMKELLSTFHDSEQIMVCAEKKDGFHEVNDITVERVITDDNNDIAVVGLWAETEPIARIYK